MVILPENESVIWLSYVTTSTVLLYNYEGYSRIIVNKELDDAEECDYGLTHSTISAEKLKKASIRLDSKQLIVLANTLLEFVH